MTPKPTTQAEHTSYPFWIIVDPRVGGNIKTTIGEIAACITGVFLSRESAEDYLKSKSHRFSEAARVYCHSGHQSDDWRELCKEHTLISPIGDGKS